MAFELIPDYSVEQIIGVLKKMNFAVFEGGSKGLDYDLNIVGIRNESTLSDVWDDKMFIFYKVNRQWQIKYFTITTDPGKHELITPSFPAAQTGGTLIIKHDEQYRSAYTLGYHGGGSWRHVALLQTGVLKGYRDKNRDQYLDFTNLESGFYGANIHAASLWQEVPIVDRYSAGCQVIQKPSEYYQAVDLWGKASKIWGPKFTYTLLHHKTFKSNV